MTGAAKAVVILRIRCVTGFHGCVIIADIKPSRLATGKTRTFFSALLTLFVHGIQGLSTIQESLSTVGVSCNI